MPKKITTEDFISRAMSVHGDKYDYSKSIYTSAKEKVAIVCKKHGVEFYQSPTNHLSGKVGCNKCEAKLKRYPIINGMKECSKCGALKSVDDFHKGARRCKYCTLIDAKLRYEYKASSNKAIIDKRMVREEIAKAKYAGKKTLLFKCTMQKWPYREKACINKSMLQMPSGKKEKSKNGRISIEKESSISEENGCQKSWSSSLFNWRALQAWPRSAKTGVNAPVH